MYTKARGVRKLGFPKNLEKSSTSTILLVFVIVGCLLAGGILGYFIGYSGPSEEIDNLQGKISALEEQIQNTPSTSEVTIPYLQLSGQIENLQNQVTSIQEQISNLDLNQDTTEVENLQNQLLTLQERISNLEVTPTVTDQNFTYVLDEIVDLGDQLLTIQQQLGNLQTIPTITYQNITYFLYDNVSLSQLFDQTRQSVVVVKGLIPQYDLFGRLYYTQVQGSGFVYSINNQMIILTNHHIIAGTTALNVTFSSGNDYTASILWSNQFIDFAVLTTDAPQNIYEPLEIVSSSTMRVGDPVIVIGTPYGLEGSMSEGIVSALNRTLIADDFLIENVIQTTAPLNPGNSGGPVLNYQGQVIGIATAIVQESQGIGFAIPSDTILEEINSITV
jgi:hypothetical protein